MSASVKSAAEKRPPSPSLRLGTLTTTLLQDLEVLSAGQDFKKAAEGRPVAVQVVNLLVTPGQAEQLSLASHQTAIQLALRNPIDRGVTKTSGVTQSQLFGTDKPRAVEAPAPPSRMRRRRPAKPVVAVAPPPPPAPPVMKEGSSVEIFLGTKRTESKFE